MIRIRKPIFSILHFAIVLFALSLFFSNLMHQYSFIKEVPIVELTTESLSTYVYEKKYDFSTDWFSQHVPIWRKALRDLKVNQIWHTWKSAFLKDVLFFGCSKIS